MIILKSIVKSLIIPPGSIIIALLTLNIWHVIRKNKNIGIYNLLIACLIWLISMPPVSNSMLRSLESDYKFINNPRADVIVVLGERFLTEVSDFSGVGAPTPLMMTRLFTAARLQKRLNIPIIVSFGIKANTKLAVPKIVERYLVEFGVSYKNIIIEKDSRDTFENAINSKVLCQDREFKNPIIVTSAYHLKRSILSFNKVGMDVTPYPSNFLSPEKEDYRWYSFFPTYESFRNSSIAIKEYFGLFFYKFFY